MHRFVLKMGFFLAASTVACSSGHTASSGDGSTRGALANSGGDPGKDPGNAGDPGKGGTCDPGGGKGGDACFTVKLSGCQDIAFYKETAVAKCGVPGLQLVDFQIGGVCKGDNAVDGASFTCCATPPPPQTCKSLPIPAELCKDAVALKEYAVKVCGPEAAGLSFPDGDPCSPKATVECCEPAGGTTPPPPEPPKK